MKREIDWPKPKLPEPPKPPTVTIRCQYCGDITETRKHKPFCRVLPWMIMLIPVMCLVVFILKITRVIQ